MHIQIFYFTIKLIQCEYFIQLLTFQCPNLIFKKSRDMNFHANNNYFGQYFKKLF